MDQRSLGRRDLLGALGRVGAGTAVGAGLANVAERTAGQPTTSTWPQPQYDARNAGYAPGVSGPVENVGVAWSFGVSENLTSPVVGDGMLYAGSRNGNVYGIDPAEGTERWSTPVGGVISAPPVLAGGSLYVGANEGGVAKLDAAEASRQWRFPVEGTVRSSPTVAGETVYAGSSYGTLYAIAAADGSELWAHELGGSVSGAAVADGTVYVGTEPAGDEAGALVALDTNMGREQWRSPVGEGVECAPTVVDGTVYAGDTGGTVYAVDAADGSERWRFSAETGFDLSPAVTDQRVYVAGTNRVFAIDRADGTERWQTAVKFVTGAPVVTANAVYVGRKGVVALDRADGSELWSAGERTVQTPPAVTPGTVYAGTSNDTLLALRAGAGRSLPVSVPGPLPAAVAAVGTALAGFAAWRRRRGGDGGAESDSSDDERGPPGDPVPSFTDVDGIGTDAAAALRAAGADSVVDLRGATPKQLAEVDGIDRERAVRIAAGLADELGPAESESGGPATAFAAECPAVERARSVADRGPVHVYHGTLESGESTRIHALAPEHADDDAAQAFIDAADRWASIGHNPNVAAVYGSGEEPRPWVAFDASGRRLADAVDGLDRADRLAVIDDLAEGLRTATLYSIAHGTVRPATVFVRDGDDPTAELIDWGLSRAVTAAVGDPPTTPFTAPEQLDGETAPTTDVYRLGTLAYWLLTERTPFADADDRERAIRDGELRPPTAVADVSDEFDGVVARATALDPDERYSSVTEFVDAVRRATEAEP